ncbi:hypothetical protein PRIPAC_94298 [Pristionchus pacificus]|uniref:Uncharacterized protein n=1 Tax=Pristionchus pacificus TaxID=54126 RepID=A0A2A6CHL0_PRIPA|nr:hypothetical protein PRIPAC_94298 [Pristionchus pacificus]|eukprot:PDM77586.1 hypothetical protein PRIPAC_34453 [Pristionchus pacificus]
MSSLRVGLSSSNSNRPQDTTGLKGLKTTVSTKNRVQSGVGQVVQENHKPSLLPLSISSFEGPICASSSPLTAEKATQDIVKADHSSQTGLSLAPLPVRVAVPDKTLEQAEQSAEYWRQIHESMEVSLDEAMRSKERAVDLLELHTNKLNESIGRLQELREVCEEMGVDADSLESVDDGKEYTGAIYRSVFEEEEE